MVQTLIEIAVGVTQQLKSDNSLRRELFQVVRNHTGSDLSKTVAEFSDSSNVTVAEAGVWYYVWSAVFQMLSEIPHAQITAEQDEEQLEKFILAFAKNISTDKLLDLVRSSYSNPV